MVVVGAGTDPSPLISHKKKIRLKALRLSALKKKQECNRKSGGNAWRLTENNNIKRGVGCKADDVQHCRATK